MKGFERDFYNEPERSEGDAKRRSAYAPVIQEGYVFETNSPLNRVEEDVNRYKSQGLEVKVHPRAFWENGFEDPEMEAILTKRKS